MSPVTIRACPCGGGTYDDCCARFHRGAAAAPTAETLMRSRYSAFALGDADYLRDTWHASTRPERLKLDGDRRWTGLDVLHTSGGGVFDRDGTVEFAAHWTAGGRPGVQRENSAFRREDRRWFYLSGVRA